jgi:UDP-glucose 4-epimerase
MNRAAAKRLLVTGAGGFIGRALTRRSADAGYDVIATSRSPPSLAGGGAAPTMTWRLADLRSDPLDHLLEGVDGVVHLAGPAHATASEALHRAVTVEGTRRLIAAMYRAKCRRLVFLSSIRAQVGACSETIVEEDGTPMPADAYGRAKRDAEQIVAACGIASTVLRPVLVADAGARGNLAMLLALARSPFPLPFGAIGAKRSLVSRASVVDAILYALSHEATIGGRFNLADPDPLDVAEIVTILRGLLGRRPFLLPVPPSILRAGLRLVGRGDAFDRLARPLVVAAEGLRRLGWSAPEGARDALSRMARRTNVVA